MDERSPWITSPGGDDAVLLRVLVDCPHPKRRGLRAAVGRPEIGAIASGLGAMGRHGIGVAAPAQREAGPDAPDTNWHCHILEPEDNDIMRSLNVG